MGASEPTHVEDTTAAPAHSALAGGLAPAPASPPSALERLAPVPLPLLAVATLALWAADPRGVYSAPALLLALNFVFLTLVSSLVAYMALRGFLVRGEPGLLLLALGAALLGGGAFLSTIAGWDDPNVAVTIHNTSAALAGACHLAGVVARRARRVIRDVDVAAAGGLGAGLVVAALVTGASRSGLAPVFFVQGAGGTPFRNAVLGGAVLLFAAAGAALALDGAASSRFKRFYALGLGLVAVGLLGVLLQPSFGSLLGWTARATQFAGGAYMLIAAIAALREMKGWALSLEEGLAAAESRLRRREDRFRAFFESLLEAVAVYEPVRGRQGEIVDWLVREANERYAAALGEPRARVVGARVGEVFGAERLARWSREWRQVLDSGEPLSYDREVGGRTYAVTTFRIDGETVGASALDVTERRRYEEALRDSDRRKSEFLAVLSHELRNPLAPLRNAAHVLRLAPPDGPQARHAREVIERQVTHLARLVDDLLEVTRLTRGRVALACQRLDLRDAVIRACDDHRPLLAERGLALQVSAGDPVAVDADPTRVAQVIGNLLQNAAKFTPAGGRVRVSLARAGGRAELRVEDDGIGIEASLLPRVFEPFTQAEQPLARTQGGLGLGLSLVKGLVELHGGAVAAHSEGAGRGSAFVVSLPLAPEPSAAAAGGKVPLAEETLDVLVVEDGEDAAAALADLLELAGHRVRVARDGRSGVALALASPPDLVLCDIGLPDLDGFGVARALRADPALARTRLVALSGYALPEDRARAAEAGFDTHLPKPAPVSELELLLADVVQARAARP